MPELTLEEAISKRRSHREFDDRPVPLEIVRKLLWAGQGTTDESGKRTVPSAHALYPLCLYLVARRVEGLANAVYASASSGGGLDHHDVDGDISARLQKAALDDQHWIGNAACILTVCADMAAVTQAFMEQPPYGVRGRRYAYIEAGAAAQNVQLQATQEGLGCVLVAGLRDEATAEILKLPAPTEPVLHVCIGWPALG